MFLELLEEYYISMSWLCGIAIAHWRGWPPPLDLRLPSMIIKLNVLNIFLLVLCALNPTVKLLVMFAYASTVKSMICLSCPGLSRLVWLAIKPRMTTLIYHGKVLVLGPPEFLLPIDELIETDNADERCPICYTYESTHKSSCCNERMCAQCVNLFLIQHAKIGDECCWFCRQQQSPDTRNFVNV